MQRHTLPTNKSANRGETCMRSALRGLAVVLLAGASWTSADAQDPVTQTSAPVFAIQPATQVDVKQHTGYFGDPYPIHAASWLAPFEAEHISGTTPATMSCTRPIRPGCFEEKPLDLAIAEDLSSNARAAGNVFGDIINHNVYQTFDGRWQMAVTLYVHPAQDQTKRWTVIAHAHPVNEDILSPPASWVADTILVGSLSTFDYANYDGKYFEDGSQLYLIYSKRLPVPSVAHDGIVAQHLKSPMELSKEDPVLLLSPSSGDASLNSEYFHTVPPAGDTFKLIETGNIVKINTKYVMFYSAGDYQQRDYKSGVAYSDTLLPQKGRTYRKVLMQDAEGVWGQPEHPEVRYLLQSQKENWPNYVASQALAPGVPSVVQRADGEYLMFFDGFLPSDAPQAPDTPNNPLNFEPDHRRPFYVPLAVHVPVNGSVEDYSDAEIARWINAEHIAR